MVLLTRWQTDPVAIAGLVAEVGLALTYVAGAWVVTKRHRPWPARATASFLAGLAVTAFVLQSGFAAYDDVFWVHVVQHAVLMGVAPLLLAFGAPVTLCLPCLPRRGARRLVGALHSRPLRGLCGRPAAAHLAVDYYGVMFVYLLTPAAALATRNEAFHLATHGIFFLCGLLFWIPIVAADPTPWRPARRTKVLMVAAGVPVGAVLAAVTSSWSVLAATEASTLIGLAVVLNRRRRPATRPARLAMPAPRAVASASALQP